MLMSVTFDQDSVILRIKILDSTVATGAGKTGLAYNTSGLIISTIADNEASATVYTAAANHVETITTLGTFETPSASCCRFKEVDSTNHKGVYELHLANARFAVASAKSLLVSIVGPTGAAETDFVVPLQRLDPNTASVPQTGDSFAVVNHADHGNAKLVRSTTPANTLSVDASHRALSDLAAILATAITEGAAGRLAAGMTKQWDVATPVFTAASVNQTADVGTRLPQVVTMAQVGGTGAYYVVALGSAGTGAGQFSLSSGVIAASGNWNTTAPDNTSIGLIKAATDNLPADPAAQSDILALNQSASRRVVLTTSQQYERPESDTSVYGIELRTYDGDGAAVAGDTTPTLTATGIVSGSLAAHLSAATNPATGVYRWTYTVASDAAVEQVRLDASATIAGSTFTISAYSLVCDFVAATWTTADSAALQQLAEDYTTSRAVKLDNLDVTVGSRLATTGYTAPPTADAIGTDAAAKILATPAQKIATNASGQVEASNATALTAQQTRDALKLAPTAGDPAAGSVDKELDDLATAVGLIGGGLAGAGSEDVTVTSNDANGDPLEGVAVWIVTDDGAGAPTTVVVAGTLYSDTLGKAVFKLDPGDYWVKRQGGANWTDEALEVVDV